MDVARMLIRTKDYVVFNKVIQANITGSIFHIKVLEEWCGPMRWEGLTPATKPAASDFSSDGDDDSEDGDGPPLFGVEDVEDESSDDEEVGEEDDQASLQEGKEVIHEQEQNSYEGVNGNNVGFIGENIKEGVVLEFQNQDDSNEESNGESNGENIREGNEVLGDNSGLVRKCREEREDLVAPTPGVANDIPKIQTRQDEVTADCGSVILGDVAKTASVPPHCGPTSMRKSVKHKKAASDNVITVGILNTEALGLIHSTEVSSDGSSVPRKLCGEEKSS